jgi:hypothetical protein
MERSSNVSSTRPDLAQSRAVDVEKQKLIEQARREIPALRAQVAASLADLRRIANRS